MVMGVALLAIAAGIDVIDATGQVDAEIAMPKVLSRYLGSGVLGVVLAGLLAAFMSTFAATVNSGASYLVRDLWQPIFRPNADERHLVRASYVATISIVVVGTLIGLYASSIRQVWDWIMMALGAAFVIPNVLRWYWWRFNGTGYAAGTLVGLAGAMPLLILSLMNIEPPIYVTFPALSFISLVASLIGTYLAKPTDESVLVEFYRSVRPFGWWGPIRERAGLTPEELNDPGESVTYAVVNVALACVAIFGAYVAPMYLVGHWHGNACAWALASIVAIIILKFTWYDHLPKAE
jgi:Na+/proline symporter